MAQTPSATSWLVFPRPRRGKKEKRRVANREGNSTDSDLFCVSCRAGFFRKLVVSSPLLTRIFPLPRSAPFQWPPPRSQTAPRTVARCTAAMWTDGPSARPPTWARRTRVRVFARTPRPRDAVRSTPRLPENSPFAPARRHADCRDPGSDADLLPFRRRPRRRRPAHRVHRTCGRRVPHAAGVPPGTPTARTARSRRVRDTCTQKVVRLVSRRRAARKKKDFFSIRRNRARSASLVVRRTRLTRFPFPHTATDGHAYTFLRTTSHRALRTFGVRCARR